MALLKYFKRVDALPASTQVVPPETVKAVNEEVKKELGKAGKRGTYKKTVQGGESKNWEICP